jgi:hypothetical protein
MRPFACAVLAAAPGAAARICAAAQAVKAVAVFALGAPPAAWPAGAPGGVCRDAPAEFVVALFSALACGLPVSGSHRASSRPRPLRASAIPRPLPVAAILHRALPPSLQPRRPKPSSTPCSCKPSTSGSGASRRRASKSRRGSAPATAPPPQLLLPPLRPAMPLPAAAAATPAAAAGAQGRAARPRVRPAPGGWRLKPPRLAASAAAWRAPSCPAPRAPLRSPSASRWAASSLRTRRRFGARATAAPRRRDRMRLPLSTHFASRRVCACRPPAVCFVQPLVRCPHLHAARPDALPSTLCLFACSAATRPPPFPQGNAP